MELESLLSVARRWVVLLVMGLVVGIIGGNLYAEAREPVYEATVRMLIGPINADANTLRAAGQTSQTYAELATNRALVRKATTGLELEGADEAVVTAVASDVTRLLRVTARSNDPQVAASVANAIASELVRISDQERELAKSTEAAPTGILNDTSTTSASAAPTTAPSPPPATSAPAATSTTKATAASPTTLPPTTTTTLQADDIAASRVGEVRVIDKAEPPATPVAPNPSLLRVLGAGIGLLIAFAIAVAVETNRRTVRRPEALDETLLGRIQRDRWSVLARDSVPGYDAAAADAVRGIAVDLLVAVRDRSALPTVMVSGTDDRAIAADVAANLAFSLALAPMRVALIDISPPDSRKDLLHAIGGVTRRPPEQNHLGVDERSNLRLRGALPNPTGRDVDLFSLEQLVEPLEVSSIGALANVLASRYDLVLLFAPPAFGSIATVATGAAVDGCVLVVSQHRSRTEDVSVCLESLSRYGSRVLGIVFDERTMHPRLRRMLLRGRAGRVAMARSNAATAEPVVGAAGMGEPATFTTISTNESLFARELRRIPGGLGLPGGRVNPPAPGLRPSSVADLAQEEIDLRGPNGDGGSDPIFDQALAAIDDPLDDFDDFDDFDDVEGTDDFEDDFEDDLEDDYEDDNADDPEDEYDEDSDNLEDSDDFEDVRAGPGAAAPANGRSVSRVESQNGRRAATATATATATTTSVGSKPGKRQRRSLKPPPGAA